MAKNLKKRAEGHYDSGELEKSESTFLKALKECDRDGQNYLKIEISYGLAKVYRDLGKIRESSEILKSALELQERFGYNLEIEIISGAKANYELSKCYSTLGQFQLSKISKEKAAELGYNPDGISLPKNQIRFRKSMEESSTVRFLVSFILAVMFSWISYKYVVLPSIS